MSEQKSFLGTEKFTRANHEKWFRPMNVKFQSKGVLYILKNSHEEYARVARPFDGKLSEELEEITLSIGNINLGSVDDNSSNNQKIILYIEKKKDYIRDEGKLKFILLQGLDDDDQALFDEYETPMALWQYLVSKYQKLSKIAAAQYRKDLNNFEFKNDLTIRDGWNKLKDIRKKIVAAKPTAKGQYDDESLLLILKNSLPDYYQSVIDDLNINENLSVDDQLKHLENKKES